jgi:glycosyltransferase involved in cell wall biosynthesis
MKNLPIITIYITNYNYGTYIKKAINSALEQSYKNIDLIIIDDASTDF